MLPYLFPADSSNNITTETTTNHDDETDLISSGKMFLSDLTTSRNARVQHILAEDTYNQNNDDEDNVNTDGEDNDIIPNISDDATLPLEQQKDGSSLTEATILPTIVSTGTTNDEAGDPTYDDDETDIIITPGESMLSEPSLSPIERPFLPVVPFTNSKPRKPPMSSPSYSNSINRPHAAPPEDIVVPHESSSHTWVILALLVALVWFCLYRFCRGSKDDVERGQYRVVASRYTARAFDDTFDDNLSYEDLGVDDPFDNEEDAIEINGKSAKLRGVIELKEIEFDSTKNEGLTLEEMNG
jgi:hypothetical protein